MAPPPLAANWSLDPSIVFLNHGSYGACPTRVLQAQEEFRKRLEAEPVRFMIRELEPLLDQARTEAAAFVGCAPDDLAFMPNATTGVNTVLRSLSFEKGDELLITDHAYNACRNALEFVAAGSGARVVVAKIPFPLRSGAEVVSAVMERVTSRTRLALIDHVTSPTGLVFPAANLVSALAARGVDALVDGAHAPGMLDLEVERLGAAYYTGNFHKWVCAPKGTAFLHVRPDRQAAIRPLAISHGANATRTGSSRFRLEFDWVGTVDPSPFLCVPLAIRELAGLLPGGWAEIRQRNHALTLQARDLLAQTLGVAAPCPDELLGSLAALPLPDGAMDLPAGGLDRLQNQLFEAHQIEVPIVPWPAPGKRLVRIAAALYNTLEDYQRLSRGLRECLGSSGR